MLFRPALVLLATAGLAHAQSFTPLGTIPGTTGNTEAFGISGDGSTIVGRGDNQTVAFRWTMADGMISLGNLPGGSANSTAFDTSLDGSVVVGTGDTDNGPRAFRWTMGNGLQDLGTAPNGNWTRGSSVSADGSIIHAYGPTNGLSSRRLISWTGPGVTINVTADRITPSPGACNGDGSIVGGQVNNSTQAAATRVAGEDVASIPDPDGDTPRGFAMGVSENGRWAVGWQETEAGIQGFVHRLGAGTIHVGDLPGGDEESIFRDVSANGFVAVGYGTGIAGREAVIWFRGGEIRSLRDYLDTELAVDLTGWDLTEAWGISDDGTVICGTARNTATNKTEAFRVEIPVTNNSLCDEDYDADGDVDLTDFGVFGAAFGSQVGDPNYNPGADLDFDGDVDLTDFGAFGAQFGRSDC